MDIYDHECEAGDDLCDLCMSSGVNVDRTTHCGKTIGIECGCDERNPEGKCGNPECEDCYGPREPEEGDYVTEDHIKFYEVGNTNRKPAFVASEDGDYKKELREHFEEIKWFPSVWFVSDHGNCHLLDMGE